MYALKTLAILPESVSQVTKSCHDQIKLSNQHEIPFFVTGGGHGVEPGFANVKNAINIQLNQFNTTSLSADARTITVGPGADFVAIYGLLYSAEKQIRAYFHCSALASLLGFCAEKD